MMKKNSRAAFFLLFLACFLLMETRARAESTKNYEARVAGQVKPRNLTGISGLVASRRQPGVIWIHNDFPEQRYLYALDTHARLLAIYQLTGVQSINWEDIALGPGPKPGVDYLYIGDIGDNLKKRTEVTIYRLPEPTVHIDQDPATRNLTPIKLAGAEALKFTYPAQAKYDAEALVIDPRSGDLFIITKEILGKASLFRAPSPHQSSQRRVLEYAGQIPASTLVTAADISPQGDQIILRNYLQALRWIRPRGATIPETLRHSADQATPILCEPQGEAIGFDPTGRGFYTLSEGEKPFLYYFRMRPL